MRKLIFSIALVYISFFSNRLDAQEKVRVAISNFSASYIPIVLANKRGYYAEEDMTVEVILMAGLTSTMALTAIICHGCISFQLGRSQR